MARAPQKTKPGTGLTLASRREVTDFDAQLEAQAEAAAKMERGSAAGKNFSFKGGVLSFDGSPIPGNRVAVIVAASTIVKQFYPGAYDPDNREAPTCFAFNTEPDELAPKPEDVAEVQSDTCAECQWNKFGSADVGKGKACKDGRKVALLPAGTIDKNGNVKLDEDAGSLTKAEFGFGVIPPSSLTAFSTFVRQVASMKRPPHAVYAVLSVEPDPKNQFNVRFEPVELVSGGCLPVVLAKHEEAKKLVELPFTYPDPEQKQQAKPGARGDASGARKPAGRGAAKPAGRAAQKPSGRGKY